MRHWLAVATMLVGCTGPDDSSRVSAEERGQRFITIGVDALGAAHDVLAKRVPGAELEPIAVANDIALLSYDAEDFYELSARMHEDHHRCAGFMLHDSLADGHA